MDICIDFDGTCVEHDFPRVGKDVPFAVETLRDLVDNDHNLILFTMRSDVTNPTSEDPNIILESGDYLSQAIDWFKVRNIPLYGVQTNPTQKGWTHSPKAYGQLYIDDSALGCPLVFEDSKIPYVDWMAVREILIAKSILQCN